MNADGTRDDSFSQIGAFYVQTTSIQSDGKTIISGNFTYYNDTLSNGLARLNNDGTLDNTFIVGDGVSGGYIYSTCIQSDGKIIIAGNITSYNGTLINRIARLNANGSLDSTFNPGTGTNDVIYTTAIQSNGKIIIGGSFTSYNGIPVNRIARLNYDGSLDNTFPPTGSVSINNGEVRTIALQSDGKIIIGGILPWFGKNIVRLLANGYSDSTFNAGANVNDSVNNICIQSDGKIIVGGNFNNYIGSGKNKIVRLDTNGGYDNNFFGGGSRLGVTDNLSTISIQSDGKIIIGGYFTSYGGINTPNIARLTSSGAVDSTFNPGRPDGPVRSTSIQTDGKIIVGGDFFSYDGIERNGITRVNGNNTLTNSSFDKSSIAIYPNPSNGYFILQTNEMNTAKSISIYTILGQKIYDAVISSNETTIDISNQPKGVYLYKVIGEEGETKSGKLVIE